MITWLASLQKITRRTTVNMSVLAHSLVFDRSKPASRYRKRMFVTCSLLSVLCLTVFTSWWSGTEDRVARYDVAPRLMWSEWRACAAPDSTSATPAPPPPPPHRPFLESVWYSTMLISVPGCKFSSTAIYFPPLRRNRWDCFLLVNFDYKLIYKSIPILVLETYFKHLVKNVHNTCPPRVYNDYYCLTFLNALLSAKTTKVR